MRRNVGVSILLRTLKLEKHLISTLIQSKWQKMAIKKQSRK